LRTNARFIGVIPAAGSGARFGADTPKQYARLGSRSMLDHAIAALRADARVGAVIVIVAPGDNAWRALANRASASFIAVGGASRAETVFNGLRAIGQDAHDDDWILVHDAARPCLAREELARLIDLLADDAVGGLLAVPLADTLKSEHDGRVKATIDRAQLWRAQTPQMFRRGVLTRALGQARDLASLTDESSAVEQIGLQPRLVQGAGTNLKVTVAEDLLLAEAILKAQGRW
jgi:2-C-methyl-D-erythritol 4-phosphate cytidylyltransferase